MVTINFMTTAMGAVYEAFIGPYVTSSLISYPGSCVELMLHDPDRWRRQNDTLNGKINEIFGADRFILKQQPQDMLKRGRQSEQYRIKSLRWLCRPEVEKDLTYIGDIDIITTPVPDLATFHMAKMERDELPYSNSIRQNRKGRLSGCQCCRTKDYFPAITDEVIAKWFKVSQTNKYVNEHMLYQMMKQLFGHPPAKEWSRPIHGFHLTPNRPFKQWPMAECHIQPFHDLRQTDEWVALEPDFAKSYRDKYLKPTCIKLGVGTHPRGGRWTPDE